ncbi:MAG: hypothetical protein H7326_08220 [Bdellovibrionaceae bacterium]|nr:hypothetical protein [Pseudobdellovibrionaceae bacterium]
MKFSLLIAALLFSSLCIGATTKVKPAAKIESKVSSSVKSRPAPAAKPVEDAEEKIVLTQPTYSFTERARNALFIPRKAYLDLEDAQVQSVFNMPGRDWKTCDMDKDCKSVGWPDNASEIEILTPPKKTRTYDFKEKKEVEQDFVKVRYKYQRATALNSPEKGKLITQEGEGWIDAAYLTNKRRNAFFTEQPKDFSKPICPNPNAAAKNMKDLGDVAKAAGNLNKVTDEIMKVTGQCVIDPRQPRGFESGNVYDNYVMPTILKQSVPKIKKEDNTMMTSQDLVDIDSLARSIYGEMAGCFKHGLQYPMTVAKIVRNRALAKERSSEFIKPPHDSAKNSLSKVVTSSSQFNVWMKKHRDKMNPSLKMALCPPGNKDKMYWQGRNPPPGELQIWENAMRIATQAVVQPEAFDRRTNQVSGFFYTSGMGQFYKMGQVHPVIEDREVRKNSCLEVWMENKDKRKPAAKARAKSGKKK